MEANLPLEYQLVDALLAEDREAAREIAAQLHARGFDAVTMEAALAEYPQLQEALFEVLQSVIPLSRRAARRRAIRAAEQRDWGEWEEGRRDLK
jgi:hypothetical protein